MLYYSRIIILTVVAISFANAQVPSGLPPCAASAITAFKPAGCSPTDVRCICSNSSFFATLQPAVKAACDAKDLAATLAFAQQLCKAVGVTLQTNASGVATSTTSVRIPGSISSSISTTVKASTSAHASTSAAVSTPKVFEYSSAQAFTSTYVSTSTAVLTSTVYVYSSAQASTSAYVSTSATLPTSTASVYSSAQASTSTYTDSDSNSDSDSGTETVSTFSDAPSQPVTTASVVSQLSDGQPIVTPGTYNITSNTSATSTPVVTVLPFTGSASSYGLRCLSLAMFLGTFGVFLTL